MWILESEKTCARLCLLPGLEYSVGRDKGSHVRADTQDTSVSRRHAAIRVDREAVVVSDAGSTYGTYVGDLAIASSGAGSQDDRVPKGQSTRVALPVGGSERVRFGLLSSLYVLRRCPMVLTTSSLAKPARTRLSEDTAKLPGASVQSAWSNRVTHVVMEEVKLTIKVVNALALAVPIVSPSFVSDVCACAANRQPLPDPAAYVPRLDEPSLNQAEISCAANAERSKLFRGMTFVFADAEQMSKYSLAIGYAGGRASVASSPSTCPVTDAAAKGVVLIRPPPGMGASQQTQNSSSTLGSASSSQMVPAIFKKLFSQLRRRGLSLIPEQNIGIAILKNSCKPDVDPSVKPVVRSASSSSAGDTPQSHVLLAPESQALTPRQTRRSAQIAPTQQTQSRGGRIPETLPGPTPTPTSASTASSSKGAAAAAPEEADDNTMLPMTDSQLKHEAEEDQEGFRARPQLKRTRSGAGLTTPAGGGAAASPPAKKPIKIETMDEGDSFSFFTGGGVSTSAADSQVVEEQEASATPPSRRSPRKSSPGSRQPPPTSSPLPSPARSPTRKSRRISPEKEKTPSTTTTTTIRSSPRKTSPISQASSPARSNRTSRVRPRQDETEENTSVVPTSTPPPANKRPRRESPKKTATPASTSSSSVVGPSVEAGAAAVKTTAENSRPEFRRKADAGVGAKKRQQQQRSSRLEGFLSKAGAERDASVTEAASVSAWSNVTVEELSRSYCKLQVTSLVMAVRTAPRYEPSTREGDLGRPVKNVKRFKKQEIRRSAQRACGMVTASQLPSSSNAGSSFMASQAEDDVRMVGDENSRSGGRRGPMDDFLEAGGGAGNGFQGRARNGSGRGRRQQQSDDENEGLWNFET